jgi:molecular chaperone DnaJ
VRSQHLRVVPKKHKTNDTDLRSNATTSETGSSDAESHKNEGFLKSIWHTLTNHPAHQKDGEGKEEPSSDKKDESPKKAEEDEKKK